MGKITSKYQVSLPKALADRLGLGPGDEIDWRLAGRELRVTVARGAGQASTAERLKLFDNATRRQAARNRRNKTESGTSRGWTREDLYDRGRTR